MAEQLKKLFYNKRLIDSPDGATLAEWKIAPWKVFAFFISLAVVMIVLYAFLFTTDTQNFLGNILFYAIVIILVIAAVWLLGNKAIAAKQRITYFLIAFILLWVMYWVLSLVFGYAGLMNFYLGGYALWIILSLLAFMGAKRIDNNIDKNDVLFALLVFLVFVGANIPMTTAGTTDTYTITNISAFNELDTAPTHVSFGDIPSQHYAQVIYTDNGTKNVYIGYDTISNNTHIQMTFTYSNTHPAGFLENVDGIITKILSLVKF